MTFAGVMMLLIMIIITDGDWKMITISVGHNVRLVSTSTRWVTFKIIAYVELTNLERKVEV